MSRLSELQKGFAAALLDGDAGPPEGVTSHSRKVPVERFRIYRNNVHASLIEVLRARYPAIERLVGSEFFTAMAREFVRAHPPRSPMLLAYGAGFDGFIEAFEPVADLPYLADVARIEWRYHHAYHAADRQPLASPDLAAVDSTDIADLVFGLHPSLGLVRSAYPAFSIWRTNIHDADVIPIRADRGAECVLVVRPELEVAVYRIGEGSAAMLAAIAGGATLGEAAAAGCAADAGFTLDQALAQMIDAGVFASYDVARDGRDSTSA